MLNGQYKLEISRDIVEHDIKDFSRVTIYLYSAVKKQKN